MERGKKKKRETEMGKGTEHRKTEGIQRKRKQEEKVRNEKKEGGKGKGGGKDKGDGMRIGKRNREEKEEKTGNENFVCPIITHEPLG